MHRYAENGRHFPPLQLWLEATSDADGNFVFEKVPPGERRISQRLPMGTSGPGPIYSTQERTVTIAAGSVTHVQLGGSGTTVSGRAIFSRASPVNWSQVVAQLSLKLPDPPNKPPRRDNFPTTDAFMEAFKAYAASDRAFWSSDAGRALERDERSYSAYCADDGSFSVPDVPPGQYNLKITISENPKFGPTQLIGREVGALNTEINVPVAADGGDHGALDLGTLEVPAVKQDAAR
jgi:hypothetical protein